MKIILTIIISLLLFTAVSAQSESDYNTLLQNCLASVESGAYSKAIESCSNALAVKKDSGIPYYLRAFAYSKISHDAETKSPTGEPIKLTYELRRQFAVADAEKCVQFVPNEPPCYSLIGSVLSESAKKDELEKAIKNLSEGIRLGDKNSELYKFRASANFNIVRFFKPTDVIAKQLAEQSINDYTTYIQAKPTDVFAYFQRTLVYEFLGKFDLAIADLSKFLAERNDDADEFIHRGNLYLNVKKYQLAIDDFTSALDFTDYLVDPNAKEYRKNVLPLRAKANKALGNKAAFCKDMKALDEKFNCEKEWKK